MQIALTSAGVGAALLLASRTIADEPSNAPGWHGPPEEHPAKIVAQFPASTAGHVAYAKWIVPVLERIGLSQDAAILFAAHLGRETGYGRSIWNYNIGNIKAGSNPSRPWFWLTDARNHRDKYRWYSNAEDGVADAVKLVRDGAGGRYLEAWNMLLSGDTNWYGKLGLLGYYEGPPDPDNLARSTHHTEETIVAPQQEYDGVVSNIRRYLTLDTDVPIPGDAVFSGAARPGLTALQITSGLLLAGGLGYWVWVESEELVKKIEVPRARRRRRST